MRILLFGASGKTGGEILRQALERGHDITAFVRRSDRLAGLGPRVQVVVGNVADLAIVDAAVPGHHAVVSALGVGTPLKHDPDVIAGVRNIVKATEKHGVRRLVYLSFIGVHESRSAVGFVLRYLAPIPLRHEIADHETKERFVKASALDWTIVRPPTLTNGPRTTSYRAGEDITSWKPVPTISRADVAHFILDELAQRRYVRKAARVLP